jgi:uncharacterized protein YbbC (DUF1343 family)
MVKTGLDRLLSGHVRHLEGLRLGLILHPASVDPHFVRSDRALRNVPSLHLVSLFGPQHGIRGEKQDNMVESAGFRDAETALPVHSLYGEVRQPTREMLRNVDVLLFDLQDVGTRVYTFVWTMTLAMDACREAGVRFVVLDRPNPIGGVVREGAVLREAFRSFVGLHPVPLRHGLTAGELARFVNAEIGCDLDVVTCDGWTRSVWFDQTGLPFVFPSPNIPTLDTCIVYPGMVLLEGTNLSEGRGTTRPFELFGAPYLNPDRLHQRLVAAQLPGVVFRPCSFEPTFQKHCGLLCGGAQIHVTDRAVFRPVRTAVTILNVVKDLAPDDFQWRPPPYEYEEHKMPIDILWGGDALRLGIESGATPSDILESVPGEITAFEERVASSLLYEP